MIKKSQLAGALVSSVGAALALGWLRRRGAASFCGASVVITGGSRGLGLVLAREFAAEGARLTLLARDADELDRAARDLRARGALVLVRPCDVRDEAAVQDALAQAVARYGRIDVLINNAGVIQSGPFEHTTLGDFGSALDTHLWGPLHTIRTALPHMRRCGGGRIVNISSIGGLVSVPHLLPYCTSKFALVGLSDGLRAELAKDGIRVTTVCPGLMRTGSHLNALFKGRHRSEFTWFTLLDSLPLSSIDVRRAARQIVAACRRGDARLTITLQARALARLSALFPELTAGAMALVNRLLPGPTGPQGNVVRSGWESRPRWLPALLTRLSDRAAAQNNGLGGRAPVA